MYFIYLFFILSFSPYFYFFPVSCLLYSFPFFLRSLFSPILVSTCEKCFPSQNGTSRVHENFYDSTLCCPIVSSGPRNGPLFSSAPHNFSLFSPASPVCPLFSLTCPSQLPSLLTCPSQRHNPYKFQVILRFAPPAQETFLSFRCICVFFPKY
jgi:hypothetical protein